MSITVMYAYMQNFFQKKCHPENPLPFRRDGHSTNPVSVLAR